MRPLAWLSLLLLVPLAAAAHPEVVRALEAIDADLVAIGRVVQVEASQGSRGPREVSIVVERTLLGEPGAGALTFHAKAEHGPGWAVGEHALFLLARWEGRWYGAALAAESPRVGAGGVAALEKRWREAMERRAAREAEARAAGADEGPSLPGLLAGGAFFAGLIWLGWRRRASAGG